MEHVCTSCGIIGEHTHVASSGDSFLCDRCFDSGNYFECPDCHQFHRKDWTRKIRLGSDQSNFKLVCRSCASNPQRHFRCENCFEWYPVSMRDEYAYENHDRDLCEFCREDYVVCDECGSLVQDSYIQWEDGQQYCERCFQNRNPIKNYYYKPDINFLLSNHIVTMNGISIPNNMPMGVELECDKGNNPRGAARSILNACGENHLCIKHDGSLRDGYEVVTQPATLAYHMTAFPWEKIISISESHGFKSHEADTCGLHVHVSRECFGTSHEEQQETIAKVILFMSKYWSTNLKFSRRKSDELRWCRKNRLRLPADGITDGLVKKIIRDTPAEDHDDRYVAINLLNENTVEFRLFKGTLKKETIFATLQYVSNVVNFCKKHTVAEMLTVSWNDVVLSTPYNELCDYIKSRNFTPSELMPDDIPLYTRPKFKNGDIVTIVDKYWTYTGAPWECNGLVGLKCRIFRTLEDGISEPDGSRTHCYKLARIERFENVFRTTQYDDVLEEEGWYWNENCLVPAE